MTGSDALLRKALRTMPVYNFHGENHVRLRDVIAALDATEPAQIDVERLARAIQHIETPIGVIYPPIQPFMERAEAIVAAYSASVDLLRGALDEAIRLTIGAGNGTTMRSRPVEEWQRLYRLFSDARAALDATKEPEVRGHEHDRCIERLAVLTCHPGDELYWHGHWQDRAALDATREPTAELLRLRTADLALDATEPLDVDGYHRRMEAILNDMDSAAFPAPGYAEKIRAAWRESWVSASVDREEKS